MHNLELEHARASSPVSNPSALLVASAAEARAAQRLSETIELDSLPDPSARLRFYRCIDQDLLPALLAPAERTRALEVMQTLFTLLDNALTKGIASTGADPKFLQIKLTNPAIRKRLDLDAPKSVQKGAPAVDWLHLCGWRHLVKDFAEYLSFPANASAQKLSELRTGHSILEERLTREREVTERTAERKKAAKEEEENRNKLAMLRYKEDRLNRKEKDERERLARAAKAAAKAKADAPASGTSSHPQSPMSPTSVPGKSAKQD